MWNRLIPLRLICTGLLVFLSIVTLLTMIRKNSFTNTNILTSNLNRATIDISSLIDQTDQLKNIASPPNVSLRIYDDLDLLSYKITELDVVDNQYYSLFPNRIDSEFNNVLPSQVIYYDDNIRCYVIRYFTHRDGELEITKTTFIGPKGLADTTSEFSRIGQFQNPDSRVIFSKSGQNIFLIHDRNLQQFFKLSLTDRSFMPGPKLDRPCIDFHTIRHGYGMHIEYNPAQTIHSNDQSYYPADVSPVIPESIQPMSGEQTVRTRLLNRFADFIVTDNQFWTPAMDNQGDIFQLDLNTLTLTTIIGTINLAGISDCEKELLSWQAQYFFEEDRFRGMVTAYLDRTGIASSLQVFDPEGRIIDDGKGRLANELLYSYDASPESAILCGITLITESLIPPLLSWLNAFVEGSGDAIAARQSIFLMPDSMIKTIVSHETNEIGEYVWFIFLAYGPALLISFLMGLTVWFSARRKNLSKQASLGWLLACTWLGLPAFLTYWFTRNETPRVTCINCGRLRLVDLERCQYCEAVWEPAELQAPLWRIIDKDQPKLETT